MQPSSNCMVSGGIGVSMVAQNVLFGNGRGHWEGFEDKDVTGSWMMAALKGDQEWVKAERAYGGFKQI